MDNQKQERRSFKNTKYYLKNADFLAELIKCQEAGKVSEELGRMMLLLCERVTTHRNFIGYSFRDDLTSEALLACTSAAFKFDPAKSSNPFAYYTSVANNAIKAYLNDHNEQRDIRDALLIQSGLNPSHGYNERHGDDDESSAMGSHFMSQNGFDSYEGSSSDD